MASATPRWHVDTRAMNGSFGGGGVKLFLTLSLRFDLSIHTAERVSLVDAKISVRSVLISIEKHTCRRIVI